MGAKEELREGIGNIHKGEFQSAESILSSIISKNEDYDVTMEAYLYRAMVIVLNFKPGSSDSTKEHLYKYAMQDLQYVLDKDSNNGRKIRAKEAIGMVKNVLGTN